MTVTRPTHPRTRIPPLQNGDRLTRAEFERRYDATPNLKKAELIEGVVYMPPPVSFDEHAGPHFDVIGWLAMYRMATRGVVGGDNGSLRLDLDNMPQPDAFLLILPEYGGQARIGPDGYVEGAPELVFEVAASTVSYDLNAKWNVYRRNGVREYVVWRVQERAVDWFALRAGRYEPLPPDPSGVYRSEVFPGLWLDAAALVGGDMTRVAQVQQEGLAGPEHAAFSMQLQTASAR
jgi:Uma2 family endonuclease